MDKPTDAEMDAWNRAVNIQYRNSPPYGGWCGYCGEAVRPFYTKLPQEFIDTACEYNGQHPDCGREHDMKLVETTSEMFGSYEIWRCQNKNCDWTESY